MATKDTASNSAPNKFTLLSDEEFCTLVQRSYETLMDGDGATVEDAAAYLYQEVRDSKVLGNKFLKNGSLAQQGSAEYALELLGSDPGVAAAIDHVGGIDGSRVQVAYHMVRSFPDGTIRQVDFDMSTANGHLRESQMK